MTKSELISAVALETGLTQKEAERVLAAMLANISNAVSNGDTVGLVGFGTFKSKSRAGRTGRNPKTGEPLTIAPSILPHFTAGAAFKAAVAEGARRRAGRKG